MSRRKKKAVRGLIWAIVITLIGGIGIYFGRDLIGGDSAGGASTDGSTVEFHFIDVGQGDAALIRTPDGNILIDAGTNASEDELRAYLDALGIKEIAYAVFTHPHEDHIGGADMILHTYKVGQVILPDATATSVTFERMMDAIEAGVEANGTVVKQATPGYTFSLGSLKCEVLAPIATSYTGMNNYSVTLRVDYGDTSVLYTGDAEIASESEMLDRYRLTGELDCDLLKVGHHGSDTSSGKDFLDAVSPVYAVISVGEGNSYGHPVQAILARLEAVGATVSRTDREGNIVFTSIGGEPVKSVS